jgi:hypothetical protein
VDEFSIAVSQIDEVRLRAAERERSSSWPDRQLHIIEYFPAGTSQFEIGAKVRRVTEFITKTLKRDESTFQIVTSDGEKTLTKFYLTAAGGPVPEP